MTTSIKAIKGQKDKRTLKLSFKIDQADYTYVEKIVSEFVIPKIFNSHPTMPALPSKAK